MEAFKQDPTKIVLGAGGTVGSQDWMKAALTAKAAGVDFKKMRFVAFEGGGEAVTALRGGHIQAYMGDAAEAFTMLEGGAPIRVLAVFNSERLPGKLNNVPTAKEQGYDIVWPIIRGFYVGPKVSDKDYQFWVDAFDKTMTSPEYAKLREQQGCSRSARPARTWTTTSSSRSRTTPSWPTASASSRSKPIARPAACAAAAHLPNGAHAIGAVRAVFSKWIRDHE